MINNVKYFTLKKCTLASLLVSGATITNISFAQENQDEDNIETVIITGFRQSLDSALEIKRQSAGAVDSIVAEDIGKFPDANLAESMQRIPGVALARGDNGEGRNISVRGLGAGFTRVRINGMEGASQTGSSDIFGAGNFGRSFDFNVFPSEIFQSLTVRKTSSANIEEGSLGATVDLNAPKPLNFDQDLLFSVNARAVRNELSKSNDPRLSALYSQQFYDGKFGVLVTAAHNAREIREVGYSAVNILRASDDQGFCTPIGLTPQNPETDAFKGTDALNCSSGNPRESDASAYNEVFSRNGLDGTPGGGTFMPRLPRYVNSENEYERSAATLTLQFQATERSEISVDYLYSNFDVLRRDSYIAAKSFGRNSNNNGKPMTSIVDVELNQHGSLRYGDFRGVDVRSESLEDGFNTRFEQLNIAFEHQLSERWNINAFLGNNKTTFNQDERLTVNIDANDQDFSIDFRGGGDQPILNFGFDISDVNQFCLQPRENGEVCGYITSRWRTAETENLQFKLDNDIEINSELMLKVGVQWRENDYQQTHRQRHASLHNSIPGYGNYALADVTTRVTGFQGAIGDSSAPDTWVRIDHDKFRAASGWNNIPVCGKECGEFQGGVNEEILSFYSMLDFSFEYFLPVRGDVGFRYVETQQTSSGTNTVAAPEGAPYPVVALPSSVEVNYSDFLPSANLVLEASDEWLFRFGLARVLSRAELGSLMIGGGANGITATASTNNPYLEPIRANTLDAAMEWYFAEGSLFSVGYFYKDIESYIQRITSRVVYSELGLPNALIENTASTPSDIFTVSRVSNTDGGVLEGIELNLQTSFTGLPGYLKNTGMLASYTHVDSQIDYILASENGVPTLTTTDDLVGLSKNSYSLTFYYEDERWSFRTTGNYRDDFIINIPSGAPDSDVLGNKATFYMDASLSYSVNEQFRLILELQNMTDERNELFIDRTRQDPLFSTRIGRTVSLGASFRF